MKTRVLFLVLCLVSVVALAACESAEERANARATEVAAEIFATQTAQAPTITPTFTPSPTPTDTATPTPTPTFTPTPTPTPTPSPTDTPAATSIPGPDLTGIVLTLEDLPTGFEEMPAGVLDAMQESMSQDESLNAQNLFAFVDYGNFEMVMGFTMPILDKMEQVGVDLILRNPELMMRSLAMGMAAGDITDQEEFPGLDDIGEASAGMTAAVSMQGLPMRLDLVIFRRDVAGVIVFAFYMDGEEPTISVGDVARLLDARAQEVLTGPGDGESPGSPPPELACDDPWGCVHVLPGEPIRVGYMLVLSGPSAVLGIDSQRSIELAVEDRGQVLGHAVELVGQDSLCSAEGGQTAATKLEIDQSLVAIVGTNCSSAARAALPIVCDAHIPMISPSNTGTDLTLPDRPADYDCYLRTSQSDAVQGVAAARFASEYLKITKAATIHDGSLYSEQLQQQFADTATELGIEIVAQEAIGPTDTEMGPVLARIAATGTEMIYYPVFISAGGSITSQARQTPGLENVYLMSADGTFSPYLLDAAGEATLGMFWSSPDFSSFGTGYTDFVTKYEAEYGEAPLAPFHAHAYDATTIILAAIEKVAVQDADGTLHIGRQALLDVLFATKDFDGLTGNLTCSQYGDCADPKIAVYECTDADSATWNPGADADSNPKKVWP